MGTNTRLEIDTSLYDDVATAALMEQRGIKYPHETIADVYERVISTLLDRDAQLNGGLYEEQFKDRVVAITESQTLIFSTAILTNTGRSENATVASCGVLAPQIVDGELDFQDFVQLSNEALSVGIGTGYDLSNVDDPVGVMQKVNSALFQIDTRLRANKKRPGASMVTLDAKHPKILEFITAKEYADFAIGRFNISVFVTEDLFTKAACDELWDLIDRNGQLVSQIPARQLVYQLAKSAHFCGEPGILFSDRLERDNPMPEWKFLSTAPCAELGMAEGDACHLSSINLSSLVRHVNGIARFDFELFAEAITIMTRLLDAAIEITIQNDFLRNSKIRSSRRIGVGVAGFASMLMQLAIPYDSQAAVQLAEQIAETLAFYSKAASVELARKRGPFPAFLKSQYQDTVWVRRKQPHLTGIIPETMWQDLYQDIQHYGLRHSSTTSFPPTGTSSQMVQVMTSFEPYFTLADYRVVEQPGATKMVQPVLPVEVVGALEKALPDPLERDYVAKTLLDPTTHHMIKDLSIGAHFKTARQISPEAHLRIAAGFQKFADDSIAKTINLHQDITVEQTLDVIWRAYHYNLKGIAVFRDGCLEERNLA